MDAEQPLTLIKAFEEYTNTYLPATLKKSPRSRIEYANDIRQMMSFLEPRGSVGVDQLSLPAFHSFLAMLDARGVSTETVRRKVSSIKSFCRYLVKYHHLARNPADELELPEKEKKIPRVLTEVEYKRLQLAVAHEPMAAAIVEVFLQTGIRLSELTNLLLSDVTMPTKITKETVGSLYIRKGKGKKDRIITLNSKACQALKTYLRVRPGGAETNHVFISKFRKGITPRGVEWLVARYFKQADIQGAHVHTLRHTFGTHSVIHKVSLPVLQEMMGHESLDTTRIYVGLSREQMDQEIARNVL